jgi:hypothetical protein
VEGKAPDVVFETTSRKTRRNDTQEKPGLYAQLGVKEYFLFDPDQEYLEPQLQGYRLSEGEYVRIKADDAGYLLSQELGLRLTVGDEHVQFFRQDTGERLLTHAERADREKDRAEREAERANQEAERVKQEAERAKQEAERAKLEAERAKLEAERAKLEAAARQVETERANRAEAELARLREELKRHSPQ